MVKPAIGSVVLVSFPFSDLSRSKLRPALVRKTMASVMDRLIKETNYWISELLTKAQLEILPKFSNQRTVLQFPQRNVCFLFIP